METKSKIKAIDSCKEYNGQNGTIYYHNLVMENGDKLNIGKKKALQVGWELNYEIIGDKKEDGSYQQEYPKAKSVQPQTNGYKKPGQSSTASFALAYAKDLAVAHIEKGKEFNSAMVLTVATEFNNWLKQNS